uniref:Ribosome assembly factor mrt4 n=1 Tax=Setaria digitata TaxID=48799 RepID=A0A915PI63_9BILA
MPKSKREVDGSVYLHIIHSALFAGSVRQKFKNNSRFFYGKNNVMAIALGKNPSTEYASELSKVSGLLKGECGLMFTNEDSETVKKYFEELIIADFARSGQTAISTVKLHEGPLTQFSFSLEPQLRKLGLPTKLDKGIVTLISDYVVCKENDKLTPDQCRLLKFLDYKMSTFHVKLSVHWSKNKDLRFVDLKLSSKKPLCCWIFYPNVMASSPFFYFSSVSYAIWNMKGNGTSNYVRNFLTFLNKVLRQSEGPVINKSPSTKNTQKQPQTTFVPAEVSQPSRNVKFSESRAYFGVDKRELLDKTTASSQAYLEEFNASAHKRKVVVSFLSSFAAICFYFWYSRKDYDGFLNAPKYEVIPTLKRYALRQQIERARDSGKDTTYLEAALAYVDVEEAVLQAEENAFRLHR